MDRLVKDRLYTKEQKNDVDWLELKAFADDNSNVAQMTEFVFNSVENMVGTGENAGYQHFLLFPPCFQKASSVGRYITCDHAIIKD